MYTFRKTNFYSSRLKIYEHFESGIAITIGQTLFSIQILHLKRWKFFWQFHIIWFWLVLDLDSLDLHLFIWLTYFMDKDGYVYMLRVWFFVQTYEHSLCCIDIN